MTPAHAPELAADKHLPRGYKTYPRVRVGSNLLENVETLIEVDGIAPLLVGQGTVPLVWLYAYIDGQWRLIVERSVSKHSRVSVDITEDSRVHVDIGAHRCLSVEPRSAEEIRLTELDLRPLGLQMVLEEDRLQVASRTLENNTFQNMRTAIGLG